MRKVKYTDYTFSNPLDPEDGTPVEKIGYFHGLDSNTQRGTIEKDNGSIEPMHINTFQFIDAPESEQRAEFAKAALAGVPSRFQNAQGEWEYRNPSNIAKNAISIADAIIEQLNAPKA